VFWRLDSIFDDQSFEFNADVWDAPGHANN
jgi:hypothetical protein